MDRNIHDDYFERFLRESVEEFRMIPSRRVWTSLYNNLHPGRKWPSLAVCLFLLSAVIYIGFSHSSTDIKTTEISGASNQLLAGATINDQGTMNQETSSLKPDEIVYQPGSASGSGLAAVNHVVQNNNTASTKPHGFDQPDRNESPADISVNTRHSSNGNLGKPSRRVQKSAGNKNSAVMAALKKTSKAAGIYQNETSWSAKTNNQNEPISGISAAVTRPAIDAHDNQLTTESTASATHQTANQQTDLEWIDNHAFYNKPKQGVKNRLTYQIYATPSVGFRNMNSNLGTTALPASLTTSNSSLVAEKDHSIVHSPALNLEAGYSLIYSLSKTFRIKGGMQLNYSNYYVHAQELDHPMGASMLINGNNGLEMINKPSTIANNQSEEHARKYSNNSFQLSLPIGADIRLAGNNRFQWFAGATIQPTYVLSGNAFLLSSDMKNYVFDANFVRKWNLNAGFETFVTYRVNQDVMINAGPQFRYQFRSSYIDQYTYDVRLYNLGIKLGIVQQF